MGTYVVVVDKLHCLLDFGDRIIVAVSHVAIIPSVHHSVVLFFHAPKPLQVQANFRDAETTNLNSLSKVHGIYNQENMSVPKLRAQRQFRRKNLLVYAQL